MATYQTEYYGSALTTSGSGDQDRTSRGSNGSIDTNAANAGVLNQLVPRSAQEIGCNDPEWDLESLPRAVEIILRNGEIRREEKDLKDTYGGAFNGGPVSNRANVTASNLTELRTEIFSGSTAAFTLQQFEEGIKNFIEWCDNNKLSTVVTPKKTLVYMHGQCAGSLNERTNIIGVLMQLCRWQYRNQLSPYEPIDEAALAKLIQKIIKRPKSVRNAAAYDHPQLGSAVPRDTDVDIIFPDVRSTVERYGPIATISMIESLLNYSRSEILLGGRLELLLDFASLVGLESQRRVLLADIALVEDSSLSDPTPIHKLRFDYHSDGVSHAARHADPRLCVVGAIAMYLYERFDCKGDLARLPSDRWMRAPVLNGTATGLREMLLEHPQRKQKMPTQSQLDMKLSQQLGYDYSDTRNIAVRYLAGFESQQSRPGMYFLPRASKEPPSTLMAKVFPFIEELEPKADKNIRGFLKVLRYLRVVLLQDAAVLKPRYPRLPIFKQPLFSSSEFEQFSSTVLENYSRTHPTSVPQGAAQNVPGMFQAIQTLQQQVDILTSRMARIEEERKVEIQALRQEFSRQNESFRQCLQVNDKRFFTLTNDLSMLKSSEAQPSHPQAPPPEALPSPTSQPAQPSSSRSENSNGGMRSQPQFTLAKTTATPFPQFRLPVLDPWADYDFAGYEMEHHTTTVNDLWEEWNLGIGGKPSIKYMDRRFGAKWRRSCAKYYQRHKTIVEEILKTVSKLKISEEEAVNKVEKYRLIHGRYGEGVLTLNQLQRHIIDARRAGRLLYETPVPKAEEDKTA